MLFVSPDAPSQPVGPQIVQAACAVTAYGGSAWVSFQKRHHSRLSVQVLYYLGQYKDGKFLMDEADGPFRLDLGDAPYAPNTLVNDDGRHLMWVWLQGTASHQLLSSSLSWLAHCRDDTFILQAGMWGSATPNRIFVEGPLMRKPRVCAEHPSRLDDNYNYAGCMSAPRELHIRQGRLVQKPLQELTSLHGRRIFSQVAWE